jgi:hypothetical protein
LPSLHLELPKKREKKSHKMNASLRFFLALLVPLLLVPSWVAAQDTNSTCFRIDGTAKPAAEGWLPCNPGAAASPCCDKNDFCLSNGLCLNAVGNNFIALQGCTSDSWEAPCNKVCNGSNAGMFRVLSCLTHTHTRASQKLYILAFGLTLGPWKKQIAVAYP